MMEWCGVFLYTQTLNIMSVWEKNSLKGNSCDYFHLKINTEEIQRI